MSRPDQPEPDYMSEENLLLEVSEDKRLRRLGINPDMDQLEIYKELKRRIAARPKDEPEGDLEE